MRPLTGIVSAGYFFLLSAGCLPTATPSGTSPQPDQSAAAIASKPTASNDRVVPVNWASFADYEGPDSDFAKEIQQFINNAARYNLNWTNRQYPFVVGSEADQVFEYIQLSGRHEHQVRPLAHIIHAVAVMWTTGAHSEEVSGYSHEALQERLIQLIHGVARGHPANGQAPGWGDQWQSALWAAAIAEGAWLLWESLPVMTQALVKNMIVHEANRFLGYRVPYWRNPDHSENHLGDTKGEENAWNSRAITVALAMMPHHANSRQWRQKASELMISSYAAPQDLKNRLLLDGREVREWLRGYNARTDYLVVNNGRLHNDYSAVTRLINKPFIIFTLANTSVPEAAGFNFANIYDAMATRVFSPDDGWAQPGGTMFRRRPDETYLPEQYYPDPRGTDWSTERYAAFLEMDMFAHVLKVGEGKSYDPFEWAKVRLTRLLNRQGRHRDGHLYAEEEHSEWPPKEAFAFDVVADVWMLTWLAANGDLSPQRNWLGEPTTTR